MPAHAQPNPSELDRQCQEASDRMIARHGWQLLDPVELARQARAHLRAGAAVDATRAVIYTYSHALHTACSGAEGRQRQNIAYSELFRYLYGCARRHYPDMYEEAAQDAIERIYAAFDRCHTPGAFLAFALQQLMDAAKMLRRTQARAVGESSPAWQHVPSPDGLDALLTNAELRSIFEWLAIEFQRKHPRAMRQFAALRLKYIDELDETAISRALNTTVDEVYVLRARAITKLRNDPAWQALAVEFGILPAERDPKTI